MRALLALSLLGLIHVSQAVWAEPPRSDNSVWKIRWTNPKGDVSEITGAVLSLQDNDRDLVFFASESPQATFQTVEVLSDEDWSLARSKIIKGKTYLLLSDSQGQVRFDGGSPFHYDLLPVLTPFKIAKSCAALKLTFRMLSKIPSRFPATLTCRGAGREVEEVLFSSTGDSQWYGAEIFENAGKGERWKSFAVKDLITQKYLDLSWGSENEKNSVRLTIPKVSVPKVAVPKPVLSFFVGLQYLSGSVSGPTTSSTISGFQIPLRVEYQHEKSWWLFGGGYDFFAFSLAKSGSKGNAISGLGVWGGGEWERGSLALIGRIGYGSRTLDAPDSSVTATFEAPLLGIEGAYSLEKNVTAGAELRYAQTSSGGAYNEYNLGFYYERPLIFKRATRFQLGQTHFNGSTAELKTHSTFLTLGLELKF